MSTGTARESFTPIGSNLPGYDNYFCRDCRRIVHVPDSGMHAADRVRGIREAAAAKEPSQGLRLTHS